MLRRCGHLAVVVVVLALGFFAVPLAETSDLPGGYLLAQAPAPQTVAVPNVLGLPVQAAFNQLSGAGLRGAVEGTLLTPSPGQVGHVGSQSPAGGARVARGAVVRLRPYATMARPPGPPTVMPMVEVPGLVGLSQEEATKVLQGRGLTLRVVGQEDPRSPAQIGRVISQEPPAGGKVARGSAVRVRVYRLIPF